MSVLRGQDPGSGRPGPVHLTIPSDVLRGAVDEAAARRWLEATRGEAAAAASTARSGADPERVRKAVDLLARCERPLLVAGSGVFYSGAEEALGRLAGAAAIREAFASGEPTLVEVPIPLSGPAD